MYERVKTAQLFLTWNSLNIIETHYFSHGPSILPFLHSNAATFSSDMTKLEIHCTP